VFFGHLGYGDRHVRAWRSEAPSRTALSHAANWVLEKEIRRKGDWSVKSPDTEPSGWAFEFNNEFYPDIDDTAMVLLGLSRSRASDSEAQRATEQRALRWILEMQSSDGGWRRSIKTTTGSF